MLLGPLDCNKRVNILIPKTIHYIWFGGNPLGEKEKKCLASWKKYLPDYKIIRWDETNFNITSNRYCLEAYRAKKWAFVSDYVRLWVLVNYGGIYMDTDVELLKSLDGFLGNKAFSGFETPESISTGIMASEKGFKLFKNLFDDYSERSFILPNGDMDLTTNVELITRLCVQKGLKLNNMPQTVEGLSLYPKEVFCPKSYQTGEIEITENTVSIHHFTGTWKSDSEKIMLAIQQNVLKRVPFLKPIFAAHIAKLAYCIKSRDYSLIKKDIKRKLNLRK